MKKKLSTAVLACSLAYCGYAQECASFKTNVAPRKGYVTLSESGKKSLDSLLATVGKDPVCKVVIATGDAYYSEAGQQVAWEKVESVRKYMVDKGFNAKKMIIQYWETGLGTELIVRSAMNGEDGPSSIPPPHPAISEHTKKIKKILKHGRHSH